MSAWLLLAAAMGLGVASPPDETEARVRALIGKLGTRNAEAAVDDLVAIGAPAVPPLVAAVRGGGRSAGEACQALARIGTPPALEAVEAAARAEDVSLRRGALGALAHLPAERSVVILASAVREDPDRRARQIAVDSLGRVGSEATLPPLVAALGDEWEWVRAGAASALGRMRAPAAAEGLVEALGDTTWEVRLRASRALAAIGPPAVAPVGRALADPDPALRWRAAWVLGQIPGDEARRVLERGGREDPDWRVRNEVAAAAERRGGSRESDFPTLARTGLHSEAELERLATITGRSLAEITDLGRPGGLSEAGFLAADEDVRSVLLGDNRLVAALGLTHPDLARPLLHVWHRIEADFRAGRWDGAAHRWNQGPALAYEGREVLVEARDTKGGQESIFDDGLTGAFWIRIRRELTAAEGGLLDRAYGHLPPERRRLLVERLTSIQTGEIQPRYVQRYGFYEGHTEWRVDPIAIALVFGVRTLPEIEAAFPGRLDGALLAHFTR